MVSKNHLKTPTKSQSNTLKFLFAGTFFVTIFIKPSANDPFNSPKFWILMAMSAYLLGFYYKNLKFLFRSQSTLFWLVLLFLASSLISTLKTENTYTAFFGDFQRRNGFLSYFALAVVFVTVISYFNFTHFQLLHKLFFASTIIVGGYSLLQSIEIGRAHV